MTSTKLEILVNSVRPFAASSSSTAQQLQPSIIRISHHPFLYNVSRMNIDTMTQTLLVT